MYVVETAKMSSKGQLVVPEAFRKRYGWQKGMTLILIGVKGGVFLQTLPQPDVTEIETSIAESAAASSSVKAKMKKAKKSLDKLASLGISLPIGIESGERRMELLLERHS